MSEISLNSDTVVDFVISQLEEPPNRAATTTLAAKQIMSLMGFQDDIVDLYSDRVVMAVDGFLVTGMHPDNIEPKTEILRQISYVIDGAEEAYPWGGKRLILGRLNLLRNSLRQKANWEGGSVKPVEHLDMLEFGVRHSLERRSITRAMAYMLLPATDLCVLSTYLEQAARIEGIDVTVWPSSHKNEVISTGLHNNRALVT